MPNFASAIPWEKWRRLYQGVLQSLPAAQMDNVASRLEKYNPKTALLRPAIESVWEQIVASDNWQPFYQLVQDIKE
ncbi:MAG: YdiU family protein [Hormoscilla sp. GM7CHS1pb]|nr:YdiU family protein [Hormoscilla sp. GM7CHS1pb]